MGRKGAYIRTDEFSSRFSLNWPPRTNCDASSNDESSPVIALYATADELQDDRLASNLLQYVFFAVNWPAANTIAGRALRHPEAPSPVLTADQPASFITTSVISSCWGAPAVKASAAAIIRSINCPAGSARHA